MKILSIVTLDRLSAAGFLVALGISLFIGAEAHAVDPAPDRPTENADGTLNFGGVSDRNLLEFTANQIWLANRRASTVEGQTLQDLAKDVERTADTMGQIRDITRMIDEAERKSVEGYLPSLPEDAGNFGRYLYRHQ